LNLMFNDIDEIKSHRHIEVKSHREINDEHVLCQDVLNVGSSKFV